jgi:hypothetical protein
MHEKVVISYILEKIHFFPMKMGIWQFYIFDMIKL